jgi:CheY-like chemotaxis protein
MPKRAAAAGPEQPHPVWIIDPNAADAALIAEVVEGIERIPPRIFASVGEVPEIASHAEAPSVVVLDPVRAGSEHALIPELRRRLHESVPVLVCGASIDATAAFAEGAAAWLAKPLDRAQLAGALRDLTQRRGWRVLVVDSNTDLRLLIKRALEQRGFEVDDLDRGNLVLGRLAQQHYDLAIMDLGLPDVSAVELLKIIRRIPRFEALQIFVMSLDDRAVPTPEELRAWGAVQFVAKYRGLSAIIESVVQHLEDRKLLEQHH